jgi:hypothetical protein
MSADELWAQTGAHAISQAQSSHRQQRRRSNPALFQQCVIKPVMFTQLIVLDGKAFGCLTWDQMARGGV